MLVVFCPWVQATSFCALSAFVVHEPGGTAARPSANGLLVDAKVLEMLWLFVCLVSSVRTQVGKYVVGWGCHPPFS